MFDKGFNAYFDGAKYADSKNPAWLNGWTAAERQSRCGWYDKIGKPNRTRNKDSS